MYCTADMDAMKIAYCPSDAMEKASRLWQGCPGIARTGRRTWVTSYTGGDHEPQRENYCAIMYSDDGVNWVDPYLVIRSDSPNRRPIDAELFRDPTGKLWLVWGQTWNDGCPPEMPPFHDGVFGVWAAVCNDPEAEMPVFSQPRRLCDGFLRNKPLWRKNGDWLICAYDFVQSAYAIYRSADDGNTWTPIQGPDKIDMRPHPDESMLVEKEDGTLWFLARTRKGIAQSFSKDNGGHWTPLEDPAIANPASRFYIGRLSSGRLLMLNHVGFTGRSHLAAQLSEDDGETWSAPLMIDVRSQVSYPDADQDEDGRIWIIHDRERTNLGELLLSSITEEDILSGVLVSEESFVARLISSTGH